MKAPRSWVLQIRNGRDGRSLSYFQQPIWMRKIGKKRKYLSQPLGEDHWNVKLTSKDVLKIRAERKPLSRKIAKYIASRHGISEGYVYHLRSTNPKVRKWKHLDKPKNIYCSCGKLKESHWTGKFFDCAMDLPRNGSRMAGLLKAKLLYPR